MQQPAHQPTIKSRSDGRWLVVCPECRRARATTAVPIGIELPVESRVVAEMMRENHGRQRVRVATAQP